MGKSTQTAGAPIPGRERAPAVVEWHGPCLVSRKPKRKHRTKNQLAAEMLAVLAGWLPTREILVVADSAYIGKHLLRQRPANVEALGPIHWKAALYDVLPEAPGRTKHGRRWPTPREMLANDQQWPATKHAIPFKNGVTREQTCEY